MCHRIDSHSLIRRADADVCVPASGSQRNIHRRLLDYEVPDAASVAMSGLHPAQLVQRPLVPADVQRVAGVGRTGEPYARVREVAVHAYGHHVTGFDG